MTDETNNERIIAMIERPAHKDDPGSVHVIIRRGEGRQTVEMRNCTLEQAMRLFGPSAEHLHLMNKGLFDMRFVWDGADGATEAIYTFPDGTDCARWADKCAGAAAR